MVMVRQKNGKVYPPGLAKIKEIISRRVEKFAPTKDLETEIFESADTLEKLCLMSGGHVRNLCLLVQDAIGRSTQFPITSKAIRRAVTQARNTYRNTVEHHQWELLAEVWKSKRVVNDDRYRSLLFNRCLLEYRYLDEEEEIQPWCDVHPLLWGIEEFKEAVAKQG